MSRVIDETKPLSDEDRNYLEARGRHKQIARIDGGSFDAAVVPDVVSDESRDEPVNYSELNVDELRLALVGRGLDDRGLTADLIARLEENDNAA